MAKIGEKMRSVASAATCGLVSPNKSAKTKEKPALPEKTRTDSSMAGIPGEARSSSSKSVRGRSSQALTKLKGQIKGQYEELVQLGTPAKRPGDPMRAIASWGDGPLGKAADFLDKADAKVSELELKAVAGALTVPVLALTPVAKAVDKHILEPLRAMTDPVQGPADFSPANRSSEKPQLFLHADPLVTEDEKAEARQLMDSISPPEQPPREQPAQRATMQEMRQFQRALREGGDYATLVKDAARLNVYIPEGKVLPNGDSTRSFGFDKGFERANRGLDPLNVFSPYIAAGRAAEHKARKDLAKREAASPELPAKSEAALDNKETGAISGDASSVADSEAPTRKGGLRKQMDKVQDRYRTLVESRVAARNEKMPILHPDTELGARHVKARTAAQSAAAAMETVPSLILDKVVSSYTKSQPPQGGQGPGGTRSRAG